MEGAAGRFSGPATVQRSGGRPGGGVMWPSLLSSPRGGSGARTVCFGVSGRDVRVEGRRQRRTGGPEAGTRRGTAPPRLRSEQPPEGREGCWVAGPVAGPCPDPALCPRPLSLSVSCSLLLGNPPSLSNGPGRATPRTARVRPGLAPAPPQRPPSTSSAARARTAPSTPVTSAGS